MSASIQSIVASEIGDENAACGYFDFALLMDLADVAGNVSDGVHVASAAGAWMALVFGFGGVRDFDGELTIDPRLPARFRSLGFSLRFHDRQLRIRLTTTTSTTSSTRATRSTSPSAAAGTGSRSTSRCASPHRRRRARTTRAWPDGCQWARPTRWTLNGANSTRRDPAAAAPPPASHVVPAQHGHGLPVSGAVEMGRRSRRISGCLSSSSPSRAHQVGAVSGRGGRPRRDRSWCPTPSRW